MSAMVSGSESASDVSCGSFSEVGARNRHVRFPPDSDKSADIAGGPFRATTGSQGTLFDHGVGTQQECFRDSYADGFRGLEINGEIELRRLLNRNIFRLLTLQDPVRERGTVSERGGPVRSE